MMDPPKPGTHAASLGPEQACRLEHGGDHAGDSVIASDDFLALLGR